MKADRPRHIGARVQRFEDIRLLAGTVSTPAGWDSIPAAYLAFGPDAYAEEISRARSQGWPVTVLDGLHLHQVVAPAEVADAILRDRRRLSGGAPPAGSRAPRTRPGSRRTRPTSAAGG